MFIHFDFSLLGSNKGEVSQLKGTIFGTTLSRLTSGPYILIFEGAIKSIHSVYLNRLHIHACMCIKILCGC